MVDLYKDPEGKKAFSSTALNSTIVRKDSHVSVVCNLKDRDEVTQGGFRNPIKLTTKETNDNM